MNKPVLPVSSLSLKLPKADRGIETYRLAASRTFPSKLEGTLNRVAFSAAHVVSDSMADVDPWLVLLHPLALVIALASFAGLLVSARSLQLGKGRSRDRRHQRRGEHRHDRSRADRLPGALARQHLGVVIRMLAFALVIAAAALTPAPAQAAEYAEA